MSKGKTSTVVPPTTSSLEKPIGGKTKSAWAVIAGVSFAVVFYIIVAALIRQQGEQSLPLWDLYPFFIVMGANLGTRIAKAMKRTTLVSVFSLGFLITFVVLFVIMYLNTLLSVGFEPLASLMFSFLMSFGVIQSGLVEEGNYDDYVNLLTGKLTWGILALHITIAYTLPMGNLVFHAASSVDPSLLGSFIIMLFATLITAIGIFGGMEEGGWIRKAVKRIK
jgi:hypothetical protein